MYIVLVLRGKGVSDADFAKVRIFDYLEDAKNYCKYNNDMESKYWTSCNLIKDIR